ncbi:urea ABC transporter ATP-binding subunit UrtE [Ancylobacter vacuolatus]|uniref:Urea transport system ATP-binding protein n=1 Tax=Ancylobacter vacuolatus TaxID=223389 RepID=A0ABU0DDW7_9HYPH|nr:urea ABC transporter ATP-binding subunit UrtE [Ancylobacter vacuolatus]MDQ0346624.1 urea transport system ATP-binding protein [Ancylobacter vacuolatus]
MSMQFAVEGLDQHYGSAQVLRQIGFEIAPGECLAVLGRNGAGKSTLLKCLMGLLAPSAGRVMIDGADASGWSPHRRSRAGLAYVPQGREIFSELTVGENVEAAARAHGTYGTPAMDEAVDLFPVLREMWKRPGGALSGGQQQQLALARALVTQPRLLILDEPTEGIQPNIVALIGEVLRALKGRLSILLVEQYLDFAIDTADAFIILSRGAVVETGRAETMTRDHLSRFIAV